MAKFLVWSTRVRAHPARTSPVFWNSPSASSLPPFTAPSSELLSWPFVRLAAWEGFPEGLFPAGVEAALGGCCCFFWELLPVLAAPFSSPSPFFLGCSSSSSSSSLELSEVLLVASAVCFRSGTLGPPGDLPGRCEAGLLCSSSLLELSESELLGLGAGAFPLGTVWGAGALLPSAFPEWPLAFFARFGAGFTGGATGLSSSELSESRGTF